MVFASLSFLLVFLPLSLLVYALFKDIRVKNWILIIFSLLFYAWGEPVWVLLLILTTIIDFSMAKLIEKYEDTLKSKIFLWISIGLSLGALIFFKYTGFILGNFKNVTGILIDYPKVDLPIGISFYTFQSISYIIDVYNGKVKAQKNYSNYLLFISLFHQLVAGPIVRYTDIEKQIGSRSVTIADVSSGTSRFIWGLFKKVFFANTAAVIVSGYLEGELNNLTVIECLFGLSMFAIQLYYDFSGYSDMAIGMGRMIGFTYNENFNFPYASKSVKEFWSRWHVSLGTFLRDYLFTPLSFKCKKWGKAGLIYSLFLTFFLSGLWHGASWNFIFWGLYFAIFIILEEWFLVKWMQKVGNLIQHVYLIIVIVFSYSLFYFVDFSRLIDFYRVLFGSNTPWYNLNMLEVINQNGLWIILSLFFLFPWGKNIGHYIQNKFKFASIAVQWLRPLANLLMLLVSISYLVVKSYNPFLYFRF